MARIRGKKKEEVDDSNVAVLDAEEEQDQEVAKPKFTLLSPGLRKKLKPFTTLDDLEPAVLGKRGRVKTPGEAAYYLLRQRNGFDLMKTYKNGKGTARKLVMPYKTILDNAKCRKNKRVVKELQMLGIPVIDRLMD